MKPKSIIFSILLSVTVLVLFNNREEASFWLFGEIRTSKLIILGIFFILGVVAGGLLFRRKKQNNPAHQTSQIEDLDPSFESDYGDNGLSEEDRKFLGKE